MTVVRFYESGEEIEGYEGGDFILTRGEYWTSKLIRFGQGLRTDKMYAWWNHAALVLNENGDIAEALSNGVVCNHISRYTSPACYLVKITASDEDRRQMTAFAESVLTSPDRTEYGWLTILSITLTLLTGSRLVFGVAGTAICSGFVAEALVRTGEIFDKPPSHMMPADLAKHYRASNRARSSDSTEEQPV